MINLEYVKCHILVRILYKEPIKCNISLTYQSNIERQTTISVYLRIPLKIRCFYTLHFTESVHLTLINYKVTN